MVCSLHQATKTASYAEVWKISYAKRFMKRGVLIVDALIDLPCSLNVICSIEISLAF